MAETAALFALLQNDQQIEEAFVRWFRQQGYPGSPSTHNRLMLVRFVSDLRDGRLS